MIDLRPFANRDVTLGAFAVSVTGGAYSLTPLRATVTGPSPGHVEVPVPDARVAPGRLLVAGWALPVERPVARVEARVDGRDAGLARPLASSRADIAAHRKEAAAPLAGFEHGVTLDAAPGTTATIEVDVVDLDGRRTPLEPVEVTVTAAPPAAVPAAEGRTVHAAFPPERPAPGRTRLAVFTHRLDLGGGQLYLQEILLGLLRDRDLACLVVTEHDGPLRAALEALGAVVHVTDYPARSLASYQAQRFELAHVVRAFDSNVCIVNTMGAGIGADLADRLDVPFIWAIHESFSLDEYWPAAFGESGIAPGVRAAMERALDRAAVLVFEADATREVYRRLVETDRLVTIPYGVPLPQIDAYLGGHHDRSIRRSAGIDDAATMILCMGTFEPRKAQAALAIAFREVAHAFPGAVLTLVGDNGSTYAHALRELVRRLDLGTRVRMEPVVLDPYPWYAAADAFVIASDIESMPRSLLEVMAFGVPVAAAGVWGVPELIEDGRNGLLFAPRDVGALAEALERLLALSRDERAELAAAGQRTARTRHDSSGYVDAYRRMVDRLASDPKASLEALVAS